VGVQEVRCDKGGAVRAGVNFFFGRKETKIINWERLFVHHRIVSAFKRTEFVSDRISYSSERSHIIIVLNVQAPTEDKSKDSKGSFYEELEQVFNPFPRYNMKILLGHFNAKLGREDIFKVTSGNERLLQDSNVNGVRIVNFATSKNLVVKSTMFQH